MKELVSDQATTFSDDFANYGGMSRDGEKVFFTLTGYVYERSGGVTRLVSRAADGSPPVFASEYAGSTADGRHVYFTNGGRLTPDDTDDNVDLYERAGGVTTLISTGPVADQGQIPWFAGVSEDGAHVFFVTRAALLPEDADGNCDIFATEPGCADIYERSGGTTKLVSTGPTGGGADFEATFEDMSADGSKVFFATQEAVIVGDTDTTTDAFERSGSTTRLVTTGPADSGDEAYLTTLPYLQASRDGEAVFFQSFAQLTGDDNDSAADVYGRFAGATTMLISAGGIDRTNQFVAGDSGGVSDDGSRVYWSSHDRLTPDDDDLASDVYEWNEGNLTRHSTGPAATFSETPAFFNVASADGSHVFFRTAQRLVAADTDSQTDIYQRAGGTTTLVSTGPTDPGGGSFGLAGISRDGTRAFLSTSVSLVAADTDGKADLYERYAGATTLISVGPAGGNGPHHICTIFNQASVSVPCNDIGISDGGDRVFFTTRESLLSNDTDDAVDVYGASAIQGYPRPQAASPIKVPLVPAYVECQSPDRMHGPPLASPSCAEPDHASPTLTVGTPNANGQPAQSMGVVRLGVTAGNAATSADEADVVVEASFTDVRVASDLSDYTGELQVRIPLRITDRLNAGTAPNLPGTVSDTDLTAAMPCAATGSSVGSTCTLTTTVDALVPGAVPEGRRAVWQTGQIEVHDGGPDGDADTPGNAPFARQGVFVP